MQIPSSHPSPRYRGETWLYSGHGTVINSSTHPSTKAGQLQVCKRDS